MKKLFLVFLVGLFLTSCMTQYKLKNEEMTFIYSHQVKLSKKMLNEKIIEYINNNFNSPQDVITTIQDGYIAARGTIFFTDASGIIPNHLHFSAAFKFEDKQYKTKFEVVKFTTGELMLDVDGSLMSKKELRATFDEMDKEIYLYVLDNLDW